MQLEWSSVICACIAGAVSLIGIIINGRIISHKREEEEALRHNDIFHEITNLKGEISELKSRVNEHNEYAKKFGEIAIAITEMRKDIGFLREKK